VTGRRKILVADLLCGAGGSSTGCERALREIGLDMELVCLNHWQTAIDTHTLNHPTARHYVQDIATVRPHLIVPEGYLDLLMASPSCTHHSVARGGKPTSDQQRSDPWHIITWLTELRVKRLIVENVWEFTGWGPVDPETQRPIPERKGEYFRAWIATLRLLGFEPEWRKLNAADYGDATTRQRFILLARSDRRPVHWPSPTHTRRPAQGAALPGMKPWRAAREIIDWQIKGRSIFGRKKDFAPKTIARIYAGAVKHNWPEPYLVILRNHMGAQGLDEPVPTITGGGRHIGLAEPVIVNMKGRSTASSANEPLPTQTAHAGHLFSAEAIILSQHNSGVARTAGDPLPTITTGGAGAADHPDCARPMLVEPFVLSQASGGAARGVSDPIPTQTTGGNGASHALISPYYGSGSGETCVTCAAPLPTVTSKGRFGVVVPVTHAGGLDRVRDTRVPLPTVTGANRGELAFITAQHGERIGQAPRVHSVDSPAPTIAATGHVDLVEGVAGYDILFRMLEPHELAAAMGFTDGEIAYNFAGTKTERIKQIGNAVSVAKMKACVGAIMADEAETQPLGLGAAA
jgi:DNA (cytosine-5)-methyltransferase 1